MWYRFVLADCDLIELDRDPVANHNIGPPWEWFLDSEDREIHDEYRIYPVHRKITGIGNREVYDRIRTHHDLVLVTKGEIGEGNVRFYWGFEPLAWPGGGLTLYRGAWLTPVW